MYLPKVKICGITNSVDLLAASNAGASAIGFQFHEESPRRVPPNQAAALAKQSPTFLSLVGVFVDSKPEQVMEIAVACGLDYVQLHGNEVAEEYSEVPAKIIKSVRVGSEADLLNIDSSGVDTLLLDAKVPGMYGGTGQRFDWKLLRDLDLHQDIILAGGLRAENVAEAIEVAKPFGLDVASGVEIEPGIKDHQKIQDFMRNAVNAALPIGG